jgi:hypothetical protein
MSIFKDMHEGRRFGSWGDFHEVERVLSEAISRGFVEEVPVMIKRKFRTDEKMVSGQGDRRDLLNCATGFS